MNNEKLKFSDIKEMLDRGEMKQTIGGAPEKEPIGASGTDCSKYDCNGGKRCPSGCYCNSSETNPCESK